MSILQAIVENNIVTNLIIGPYPNAIDVPIGITNSIEIGWTYNGTTFLPPIQSNVEYNKLIEIQLLALDLKRIRPLAEGDTQYLNTINAQVLVLRGKIKK